MEKLNVDCLILIFNTLRADKKSLYSCLLVNREWCHLVVPILWENYSYFFNCIESREKLFNIILSQLPPPSKQLLFDNDIMLPQTILSNHLTFNYISFCKFLDTNIVENIVNMAFKNNYINFKKIHLLEQEIYKLFIGQCKRIKELVWETYQPLSSFPGTSISFSQLYSLSINMDFINSDNLYEMAQICKDLNKLHINKYSHNIPGLISLIDAQRNLKMLIFDSDPYIKKVTCEELGNAIARKSSTLNNLSLFNSVGVIPHSFLSSLVNLKNLYIVDEQYDFNKYQDIKEFQHYLEILEFPDLQSLYFNVLSFFKELALLIEKTKGNLTCISVCTPNESAKNTGMLIKSIANNCPKIKFLTTHLGSNDLFYLKSLLLNCRNLTYLNLRSLNENNNNIGDELLDILTKFSPMSLIMVTISGDWKYSVNAFQRFFGSYRGRKLFCFDIIGYNFKERITSEHVEIVKKYFDEGIIRGSNLLSLYCKY
ncbi:hypothetical protein RclHR1_03450009 [Rhizophagus clarus]|uniref:F-box domain-containing protein n=1 Tax=Rhizophagus clarus TaxID=94130 RepID=A0A2Z6RLZ1_9GLOM|nr:hypothetical protein RclHR1_03450009 [Rhizophagus clarus]GES74340.1 hypothetical protein GLOIN_2v1810914 [Rhizophagus clarus]